MKAHPREKGRGRTGFTLIELLVVMLILGLLAAIAIPRFDRARDRAHLSSISRDIRHLGASQELYFQTRTVYAVNMEDLGFRPTPGVEVEVTEATTQGWAGVGTHGSLGEASGCAVYVGNATPPALPNGQVHSSGSGVVQCTN